MQTAEEPGYFIDGLLPSRLKSLFVVFPKSTYILEVIY